MRDDEPRLFPFVTAITITDFYMNDRVAQYMLFTCNEQRYAVSVEAVDEISGLLPEYPLPDAPRFLRGVVTIHGKLAAVLDLSMYLGCGALRNGQSLLLLKLPETGLALLVNQVERIISAEEIIASEPGKSEFEKEILMRKRFLPYRMAGLCFWSSIVLLIRLKKQLLHSRSTAAWTCPNIMICSSRRLVST